MSRSELAFPLAGRRVFVAGHRGMVGSAIVRRLGSEDCTVIGAEHGTLDLRRQADVEAFMARERPDAVILAAARVGGIAANSAFPANFLYDNLALQLNVIEAARQAGVAKLLMLGSSCIYPVLAPQPIPEDAILTGPLEPTNRWYAIAKIAGLMQCQAYREQEGCDFISAMPTNLYGPGDNFDAEGSHVIPGLMRRFHDASRSGAEEVTIWGTGKPRREFLHVDDCADALVFLLKHYSGMAHVNVGFGSDLTIAELAALVAETVGFEGRIICDTSRPDGAPQKLLDVSTLNGLGWRARIGLREGLAETYAWFLGQLENGGVRGYAANGA
ncbi:GDP-L-fucose synthase [Afifella sp. IM 167]|uniref:GDP-L-fucose synthase family protein n=1 Tax=Afifella sp. IM 167 TaxID=2033586 RepID=UPI001CCD6D24|nr:GDP-fucose synthetase [Afifella sp. IM 167]